MKVIEIARKVNTEHQCCQVREDPAQAGDYQIRAWHEGGLGEMGVGDSYSEELITEGWMLLDAFTASAIVAVYDAVNEANKQKLESMRLTRVAEVCLKVLSK